MWKWPPFTVIVTVTNWVTVSGRRVIVTVVGAPLAKTVVVTKES